MNQEHTAHIAVDPRELHTVRDWVRFYVSEMRRGQVFFGHGSSNAFDEAVYMVQAALSLPIGDIGPFWDARVTTHETTRLVRFITQRVVDRKPASYITGEAWLQGHSFKVDERVIIPRSFIAELLADQFTPWVNAPEMPFDILDMCTGSGCLAILAAHMFENAEVDAVDLSVDAISVARENIALHDLKHRVHAIESDLFSQLHGKQYDFILTNPPYVNEASMKKLPPEYLHEPRMALA
ncbi:MAG: 50S ribosomal protein L3 N(5)-glutamine methyltransferase, partial [Limnobacter sp.]